jgi:hypothetical protein
MAHVNIIQTKLQGITEVEGKHPLAEWTTNPQLLANVLAMHPDVWLIMEYGRVYAIPEEVWMPKELFHGYVDEATPGTFIAFRQDGDQVLMVETQEIVEA